MALALDYLWQRRLDSSPNSHQVNLNHSLKVSFGNARDGRWWINRDPGVGEDNVDATKSLNCGRDSNVKLSPVGCVHLNRNCAAGAKLRCQSHDRLVVYVGQHQLRALGLHRLGTCRTNTAAGAGDQDNFVGQIPSH